MISEKFTFVLA